MYTIHYKITDERDCAITYVIFNILNINNKGHKLLLGMYILKTRETSFYPCVLTALQNPRIEDIITCIKD